MSLRNYITENIILPLNDLVKGERVCHFLRMLKESESWSREELDQYQNMLLQKMMKHISEKVPFYRDYFKNHNIDYRDIRTKADLKLLPIVSKDFMRKEGVERFMAEEYPKRDRVRKRSSGSTGTPFTYYVSKEADSLNTAAKIQTWYRGGYRLGDKYLKIGNGKRNGLIKKIQDLLNNSTYVALDGMDEDRMFEILDLVDRSQPNYIRAYPTILNLLADKRKREDRWTHKPKLLFTTGETFQSHHRELIEDVFGCKVLDSYSCEGTANTSQCLDSGLYHVSEEYGIIEVLDSDSNPIRNGIGRVVSTDLWNYAMPFIRYDTQDLVELYDKICSCGSCRMTIKHICGRDVDILKSKEGRFYTTHELGRYIKSIQQFNSSIDGYQIVEKRDGSVLFRLVVNSFYNSQVEQFFIDWWQKTLGRTIKVECVDRLPIYDNNKRRDIIHE